MAFSGNEGNKEVVKQVKLFTGVAPFKVLAINPTVEELQALGINYQNEIKGYTGEKQLDDGSTVKTARIDLWIQTMLTVEEAVKYGFTKETAPKIKTKISFFLEDREQTSKAGDKKEFINNFGRTCWGDPTEGPTAKWYDHTGSRVARVGEERLINFIRTWINASNESPVFFEKFSNLFNNDTMEMQEILKEFKDHLIRCLLVVNEKNGQYYQNVFTGFFERSYRTAGTTWDSHFKKQDKNGKYSNKPSTGTAYTIPLKEFEPLYQQSQVQPDPDPAQTAESVMQAGNAFV